MLWHCYELYCDLLEMQVSSRACMCAIASYIVARVQAHLFSICVSQTWASGLYAHDNDSTARQLLQRSLSVTYYAPYVYMLLPSVATGTRYC